MSQQPGLFDLDPAADPAAAGAEAAPATAAQIALAARLPPSIRLGTSSWSFPGWAGLVYAGRVSARRLARAGLAAYARHPLLRAVGIDRTYYAPLAAGQLRAFADAVPDGFRFLVKAHDAVTVPRFGDHPRHGDRRRSSNPLFLDPGYAAAEVVAPYVEGLGAKAGVLLFQFPAGAATELGRPAELAVRLGRFLRALPEGPRYAVELRSPAHAGDAYRTALADAGAIHCLNVHPAMPAVAAQAAATIAGTAAPPPLVVVRWMLGRHSSYQQAQRAYAPFDRLVREDSGARAEIAEVCASAAAGGREAIVIINNKAEGSAPLSAFRLAEEIARRTGS